MRKEFKVFGQLKISKTIPKNLSDVVVFSKEEGFSHMELSSTFMNFGKGKLFDYAGAEINSMYIKNARLWSEDEIRYLLSRNRGYLPVFIMDEIPKFMITDGISDYNGKYVSLYNGFKIFNTIKEALMSIDNDELEYLFENNIETFFFIRRIEVI